MKNLLNKLFKKEKCNHEPNITISRLISTDGKSNVLYKCKKCGRPIKNPYVNL